jgi:hypothetical protein
MADKVAKASPDLARQVAHGEKSLPEAVEELTGGREKSARCAGLSRKAPDRVQIVLTVPTGSPVCFATWVAQEAITLHRLPTNTACPSALRSLLSGQSVPFVCNLFCI